MANKRGSRSIRKPLNQDKGTKTLREMFAYINQNVLAMNQSKIFAGLVIIVLNVSSKFVNIKLSKSMEGYLKYTFSRDILVFAMAWMGTRDIYTALVLTAVFTILSDHLFNEESPYCCVPEKYRILAKLVDENSDGDVSEQEITNAIAILEKARRDKQKLNQRQSFTLFGNYLADSYKSYN